MDQRSYQTIVACIQYGAPVLTNDLVTALNTELQLADQQRVAIREADRKKAEEEMKRQQEQKAREESKQSKVTK